MDTIKYSDIKEPMFRQSVEAIDSGNISLLADLLNRHPSLISEQTHFPNAGYFEKPYLIYFVADNPIRNGILPYNILQVIQLLITKLKQHFAINLQEQLDYTLGLIASGRTPRESGKQIEMMDLLIDGGAKPGNGLSALANGNPDAAKHLIERGGKLTLPVAVCFGDTNEVESLLPGASPIELITALTAAAFYAQSDMISLLLSTDLNPNGYPEDSGFHRHATPLHQAVSSGSLTCVKLLIEAGANPAIPDKVYNSTPLEWASYMQTQASNETLRNSFKEIEEYLKKINFQRT